MITTQLASVGFRRGIVTHREPVARRGAKMLPFIAAVLGAVFALSAHAQSNLKIGVVNVNKLLDEAPQSAAVTEKLKSEFTSRQNEIVKMQNDLQAKNDRFQKDKAVMGEEERLNLERQIRDGQRDLQRAQNEYAEDLNVRRTEESNKLVADIAQRVRAYASAQKYDLVLSDAVYVSGTVDITADVLKMLQADAPKAGGAAGAKPPAPAR